jgi:hypothetical protein
MVALLLFGLVVKLRLVIEERIVEALLVGYARAAPCAMRRIRALNKAPRPRPEPVVVGLYIALERGLLRSLVCGTCAATLAYSSRAPCKGERVLELCQGAQPTNQLIGFCGCDIELSCEICGGIPTNVHPDRSLLRGLKEQRLFCAEGLALGACQGCRCGVLMERSIKGIPRRLIGCRSGYGRIIG